jgi:hypothetical protein
MITIPDAKNFLYAGRQFLEITAIKGRFSVPNFFFSHVILLYPLDVSPRFLGT